MKKGLKTKKMAFAGVGMALALTILGGGFAATATKSEASSGTNRDWKVDLPHHNENYYFKAREKETNEKNTAYVKVDELGDSPGVNVFFCSRNGNDNLIRVTDVRRINKEGQKKTLTYESHWQKGKMIRMGIENQDDTWLVKSTVSGTVNYK